jgi:hypothetical protein
MALPYLQKGFTADVLTANSFSMPAGAQNPLTGYQNANLLEEGCIQITKEEDGRRRSDSVESSGDEEASVGGEEHENLHLKWRWTELKR